MAVSGLDKIVGKILADAKEEADGILAQAEKEAAEITAKYRQKAEDLKQALLSDAVKKRDEILASTESAVALARKNKMQSMQADEVEKVFSGVYDRYMNADDDTYTDLLAGLLAGVLYEQSKAEQQSRSLYGEDEELLSPDVYEVRLNSRDMARAKDLLTKTKQKVMGKSYAGLIGKVKMSSVAVPIDGGFILSYGDIETNCSFSVLFAELRQELSAEVGRVLFEGEETV